MSGFYNNLKFDSCYQDNQVFQDQSQNDYVLNLNAVYRQGDPPIRPLSVSSQPTFYGPLRGSLVTQESFLEGRGQTLTDCPSGEVFWLPESLFPANTAYNQPSTCQRSDLEPLQSRMKKSCNGLEETDTSEYWMLPGNWQNGYSGPTMAGLQTRMPYPSSNLRAGSESYGSCQQNYGLYGSSRNFGKYSL
jgi:hypothetical protein